MTIDFEELRENVQWLRGEDGVVPEVEAASVLLKVLGPLFREDGFQLSQPHGPEELGVDLIATGSPNNLSEQSIGIEYKHRGLGRPSDVEGVRQLLSFSIARPFDRLILIDRFGFTPEAIEEARRAEPVSIELLDLRDLEKWI